MGLGLVLAAAALLAADISDVSPQAPPPQPIIGGEPTKPGEFDAVVAVLAGQGLCTGTVVTPNLVLTAGHCLADLPEGQAITVFYGDEIENMMSVEAESFGVHPEFCATCKDDIFDYGYVLIGPDFQIPGGFLLPLVNQAEWDEAMQRGGTVTLVGFGEDPRVGGMSNGIGVKRKVTTDITDFSPKGFEFFAGGDDRDSCNGDSGGPAFVRLESGAWRLAGITSRGSNPCGDGGFYGVPYAALCFVREETGVDLLPEGCSECSCLDTEPPPTDEGCTAGDAPRAPGLGLVGLAILALLRRRGT